MVMWKDNHAVLLDPTIVTESNAEIQKSNAGKLNKYRHPPATITEKYSVNKVTVKGLAVGARSGWHSENTKTLAILGIEDKGFEGHLCRLAL
ncbi:hypothetical protein DPMN_100381 [Dreissena polymorpha]|uniref:Uncharacterized protein n=1 Tax=Dreissena polymorpha TaxID=45954 RepID=A0A9D4LGY3_DREPO|nr:hypothetical protein DPMN_100381 [Dreissena polymorpha]